MIKWTYNVAQETRDWAWDHKKNIINRPRNDGKVGQGRGTMYDKNP